MIRCSSCGSSTPLPADLTIATFSCGSCQKHGVFAVRDQLMASREASRRRTRWITLGVVAVVLVVGGAGFALVSVVGAVLAVLR